MLDHAHEHMTFCSLCTSYGMLSFSPHKCQRLHSHAVTIHSKMILLKGYINDICYH